MSANWSPNKVPSAADNVLITNDGAYTITLNSSASVASFTLGGSSGTQTFTIVSQTLTLNGPGLVGTNGVLNLIGGTITGTGDLTIESPLSWTGGIMSGTGATFAKGGLALSGVAGKRLNTRRLVNSGSAIWSDGGPFIIEGGALLTNTASGTFDIRFDATFLNGTGGGMIANAGVFRQTAGSVGTRVRASIAFFNHGTVEIQSGALTIDDVFTQTSGLTFLNGGNITNSSALRIVGGVLAGSGVIRGGVTNNGVIDPGLPIGKLTIAGAYTQTPNGAMNIEVKGATPGADFDQLLVSGAVSLAGVLNLGLTNGFNPPSNAGFTFMTNANRSGTFATFNYPSNDVGVKVNYTATNTTIQVVNTRPIISPVARQVTDELTLFTLLVHVTDSDLPAQTFTYVLTNSPVGSSIDTNGVITWTPTEVQGPGTTLITVLATDSGAPNLTSSHAFEVIVNELNAAPALILPSGLAFDEQTTLTATATAFDSDIPANTLTFELVSGPPGLTVSPAGVISWTPGEAHGPNSYAVAVRVTDHNTNAAASPQISVTNSFTLTIDEVNLAPVLGLLNNYSVNPGETIIFTATATDPDLPANTLSFDLPSPLAGATVNPETGLFNWRPGVALANSTNLVAIRVSDDGTPPSTDLEQFTVIVRPLAPIVLKPISYIDGQFTLQVTGTTGPDYIIMSSTNSTSWSDLSTNLSPALPFEFIDTETVGAAKRFYRTRLEP